MLRSGADCLRLVLLRHSYFCILTSCFCILTSYFCIVPSHFCNLVQPDRLGLLHGRNLAQFGQHLIGHGAIHVDHGHGLA